MSPNRGTFQKMKYIPMKLNTMDNSKIYMKNFQETNKNNNSAKIIYTEPASTKNYIKSNNFRGNLSKF